MRKESERPAASPGLRNPPVRCFQLWLAIAITACGGQAEPHDGAGAPNVARMPLEHLDPNGPELRRAAVAVSRFGQVAFTGGFTEGPELITVVDSSGRLIGRMGVEGGGPGELHNPFYLFFQDSVLFVADVFEGRLVQYSVGGVYLGAHQFGSLLLPAGHVPDSIDLADYSTAGPRVIRRGLAGDSGYRTILPRGDTLFPSLIARQRAAPVGVSRVGIGSTTGGALVGDGIRNTLFEYTASGVRSFGRPLPVQTANAEDGGIDTLSYFGLYAFGIDARDRVWVGGRQAGEGFLDVYQDRVLLGTIPTPCLVNNQHGLSVAGHWVAMLCAAEEEAPVEVRLQLYRIVDQPVIVTPPTGG